MIARTPPVRVYSGSNDGFRLDPPTKRLAIGLACSHGIRISIMDQNGLMFGLFHMTRLVDLGHLGGGSLALIGGLISARTARAYFWLLGVWYTTDVFTYLFGHLNAIPLTKNFLVNLQHILIFIGAYWIALRVDKPKAGASAV
jgi:hypothetical protein